MEVTILPLMLVGMIIPLLLFIFWIWMLIDCLTKESSEGNDKLIWALVLILTNGLGALIYFFVRRPQRIRELGR